MDNWTHNYSPDDYEPDLYARWQGDVYDCIVRANYWMQVSKERPRSIVYSKEVGILTMFFGDV